MSGENRGKRGRGRPEKAPELIGVHSWQVWTFLEAKLAEGVQMKVAVDDAAKAFGISPAEVYRRLEMAETVGAALALRAVAAGVAPAEAFAALGMAGLWERPVVRDVGEAFWEGRQRTDGDT